MIDQACYLALAWMVVIAIQRPATIMPIRYALRRVIARDTL